jgi:hypothetical protein
VPDDKPCSCPHHWHRYRPDRTIGGVACKPLWSKLEASPNTSTPRVRAPNRMLLPAEPQKAEEEPAASRAIERELADALG